MTRLLLSTLSWPDGARPELRETGAELPIGRGRESGWVLADPKNLLSRRHCVVAPFGDGWRVTDLSLNGTFINDSDIPLGRDQSHELHDGDRIRVGSYVIEARYQVPPSLQAPGADRSPFAGAVIPEAFTCGFPAHLETPGRSLPEDFAGQPSADHSVAVADAWHPPPPGRIVIPEAWDLDEDAPGPPAEAARPSALRLGDDFDPNEPPIEASGPLTAPPPAPPMQPTPLPGPPSFAASASPAATAAASGLAERDTDLFRAFLRGAGLPDAGTAEPAAIMECVGKVLRTVVDRLRQVQANRGTIKREFRILATVVDPEDNNPVKFSASNEAALRTLLTGRRPADQAVADVLDEIRLHELAMIAAMRDAVGALLEELNPAHLRGAETTLSSMLPAQRKARAFEQYEALHARTVRALADNFDSVFGKAFARAYERVVLDEENRPMRTRP